MLSKLVARNGRNWDQLLGSVLFAYHATPHSSTGESLFFLARIPTLLAFSDPVIEYSVCIGDILWQRAVPGTQAGQGISQATHHKGTKGTV